MKSVRDSSYNLVSIHLLIQFKEPPVWIILILKSSKLGVKVGDRLND